MHVRLHPLEGKYYRTYVTVTLDDGREVELEITSSDNKPSEREGFLLEHPEEICDGHYERDATLIVARAVASNLSHLKNRF